MTVSLSLTPEMEQFVNEKVNSGAYPSVNDLVGDALVRFQEDEISLNEQRVTFPQSTNVMNLEMSEVAPVYVRPTTPPDWVLALTTRNLPNDGTNGLHRVIGKWPGDETEEELLALERQMDDEDAGRA